STARVPPGARINLSACSYVRPGAGLAHAFAAKLPCGHSPGGDTMYQANLLQGQRILVTGGGTGLGRAMAEHFLSLGADIAICGRRKAVCDETAAAWRAQFPGRSVATFGVDIRMAQAVEDMVEALWQDGGLTGLVNNAAGNFIAPTESL